MTRSTNWGCASLRPIWATGRRTADIRPDSRWLTTPDCTAIYAANDQMAYGAMLGLQAAGKRVPEDVSIVGVDDSLSGTIPRLSLTTMRMKFNDIGREAFFMTKRLCEGLRVPSGVKTVVPAELVERGSVRDLES